MSAINAVNVGNTAPAMPKPMIPKPAIPTRPTTIPASGFSVPLFINMANQMFSPRVEEPRATATPVPTAPTAAPPTGASVDTNVGAGTLVGSLMNSAIDIFATKLRDQECDPKLISAASGVAKFATYYLSKSLNRLAETQQKPPQMQQMQDKKPSSTPQAETASASTIRPCPSTSIYDDLPNFPSSSATSKSAFCSIINSLTNSIIEPLTSKMEKQGRDPKMIAAVSDSLKLMLDILTKLLAQLQKPTQPSIDPNLASFIFSSLGSVLSPPQLTSSSSAAVNPNVVADLFSTLRSVLSSPQVASTSSSAAADIISGVCSTLLRRSVPATSSKPTSSLAEVFKSDAAVEAEIPESASKIAGGIYKQFAINGTSGRPPIYPDQKQQTSSKSTAADSDLPVGLSRNDFISMMLANGHFGFVDDHAHDRVHLCNPCWEGINNVRLPGDANVENSENGENRSIPPWHRFSSQQSRTSKPEQMPRQRRDELSSFPPPSQPSVVRVRKSLDEQLAELDEFRSLCSIPTSREIRDGMMKSNDYNDSRPQSLGHFPPYPLPSSPRLQSRSRSRSRSRSSSSSSPSPSPSPPRRGVKRGKLSDGFTNPTNGIKPTWSARSNSPMRSILQRPPLPTRYLNKPLITRVRPLSTSLPGASASFKVNIAKNQRDSTFVIKAVLPSFTADEISLNFLQKNKFVHTITIAVTPKHAAMMPPSNPVETFVCNDDKCNCETRSQLQQFTRGYPVIHPFGNFRSIKNEWSRSPMSREISLRIAEPSEVSPSSTLIDGILTVIVPFTPPKTYTNTTIPITTSQTSPTNKANQADRNCQVGEDNKTCRALQNSQSGNACHRPTFVKSSEPCTELIHCDINGRVIHPPVGPSQSIPQFKSSQSSSSYPMQLPALAFAATNPWLNSHMGDPRQYSLPQSTLGMPRPPWIFNNTNDSNQSTQAQIPVRAMNNQSHKMTAAESTNAIQQTSSSSSDFIPMPMASTPIPSSIPVDSEFDTSRLDSLAASEVSTSSTSSVSSTESEKASPPSSPTSEKSVHIYSSNEWE